MVENRGNQMYSWASDLFPINRSITGQGVRDTLLYIKNEIPELEIKEIPTGTQVLDWVIPKEWNVSEAYLEDETGKRIIDFKDNNLHLVGYSVPVDDWFDLEELDKHLYSIEEQPDFIPYVTSYFKERWGFCISHSQRLSLKKGNYHVVIKSVLESGCLNYGELIIPGQESEEVLLSTYVCHPSMANNEISGPVVTMALANWILGLKNRRYTYRILFVPETIGAIAYLSMHWQEMKKKTISGFVLTCVGDERTYSLMPSRLGNTLADRVALHVSNNFIQKIKLYSFLDRGSDERQYCSPFIDLPVVSIMRSKYAEYPEYHTSNDNLDLISPQGLFGGFEANRKCLHALELNKRYMAVILGEPKMDKRGLRDKEGAPRVVSSSIRSTMGFLMYADGADLLTIAEKIELDIFEANKIAQILLEQELIKLVES